MAWIPGAILFVIGLPLAYYSGVNQDRANRKAEAKEAKRETIRSVRNELDYNEKLLNKGFEGDKQYGRKAFWYMLRVDAYQSIVSSERYQMLNNDTQTTLSDYYAGVKQMNEYTSGLNGEEESYRISRIYNAQTPLHPTLLRATKDLRALLEKETF